MRFLIDTFFKLCFPLFTYIHDLYILFIYFLQFFRNQSCLCFSPICFIFTLVYGGFLSRVSNPSDSGGHFLSRKQSFSPTLYIFPYICEYHQLKMFTSNPFLLPFPPRFCIFTFTSCEFRFVVTHIFFVWRSSFSRLFLEKFTPCWEEVVFLARFRGPSASLVYVTLLRLLLSSSPFLLFYSSVNLLFFQW